ncbi:MAG: branched-chain amino acid transaminase [Candidatus Gracilibacteria bacterium]|nr:branched-chain amino acid transaminase [Candidatus Gracilibacteria bacterium]
MQTTKYIWMNGKLIPWKKATVHVLTHTLHYGSGVFEGIRVYETTEGPAIRRLKDHVRRLFASAKSLRMKIPFTQKQVEEAIIKTVKKNKLKAGYIRPLAYFGYGQMGLRVKGCPVELMIACWPWGKYLSENPIKVKSTKIMRIHPQTCYPESKVCGYYVNSIFAVNDVVGKDCDEALLLDYKGNIAEGPGENFFMVKKGVIYTPPLGTVLKGITRETIMMIANDLGYIVKEKSLKLKDAYTADEAFFTGTAAEVTPIGSIDGKKLSKGKLGPVTEQIRTSYMAAVHGEDKRYKKMLTVV